MLWLLNIRRIRVVNGNTYFHIWHVPILSTGISSTPLDLQISTSSVSSDGATFHSRIRSLIDTTFDSLSWLTPLSSLPFSYWIECSFAFLLLRRRCRPQSTSRKTVRGTETAMTMITFIASTGLAIFLGGRGMAAKKRCYYAPITTPGKSHNLQRDAFATGLQQVMEQRCCFINSWQGCRPELVDRLSKLVEKLWNCSWLKKPVPACQKFVAKNETSWATKKRFESVQAK